MMSQKRHRWLWIPVVAVMLLLFGPATLVATNGDDDFSSEWQELDDCMRPADEGTPGTLS